MVDERIHVLDHQLQTRVDIVREPFAAQNARQHALAVEDVLPQQHRTLLQGIDATQHLLVDRILAIDIAAQRRHLTGDQLDHVGIVVDPHFEQRDKNMIARWIVAVAASPSPETSATRPGAPKPAHLRSK